MQPFANLVKVTLPNYLAGLPIPDSFTGWFKLGFRDWLSLVPMGVIVAGASYVSYRAIYPNLPKGAINPSIEKDNPKVVHSFDIEDIDKKAAFCRCWKSKKFPYCDGAHGAHNRETGDNVGPVVVKHKEAA